LAREIVDPWASAEVGLDEFRACAAFRGDGFGIGPITEVVDQYVDTAFG
jgi:hypothetical protein